MQVVDVKLGSEGDVNVQLIAGSLQITVSEDTAGLKGGLSVSIPLKYFLDALVVKLGGNPLAASIVGIIEGVLAAMP